MYDNLNIVTNGFKKRVEELGYDQAWILRAEISQRWEWQKLLERLDTIIAQMPSIEKKKFAQRFTDLIPNDATQFKEEYDNQFLDALVEVLGYGFLQEIYPSCKVIIQIKKDPDLIVLDNTERLVAAMACKAIRTSIEHDDYIKHHQGEARPVDHRLTSPDLHENPLLKKVHDTLSKAEAQVNKSNAPSKFIFIDFSWDPSAQLQEPEVKKLIEKCGEELHRRSIKLIATENYQFDTPFVCS